MRAGKTLRKSAFSHGIFLFFSCFGLAQSANAQVEQYSSLDIEFTTLSSGVYSPEGENQRISSKSEFRLYFGGMMFVDYDARTDTGGYEREVRIRFRFTADQCDGLGEVLVYHADTATVHPARILYETASACFVYMGVPLLPALRGFNHSQLERGTWYVVGLNEDGSAGYMKFIVGLQPTEE
jgi:hypothetical protein